MSINWVMNCSNNSVLYIISVMSPGSMMSWSMCKNGIFNIISVVGISSVVKTSGMSIKGILNIVSMVGVGSVVYWTNYSVVGSKDGILLDVISMNSMSSMSVVIMSVD